jgi:hypothetical protein
MEQELIAIFKTKRFRPRNRRRRMVRCKYEPYSVDATAATRPQTREHF